MAVPVAVATVRSRRRASTYDVWAVSGLVELIKARQRMLRDVTDSGGTMRRLNAEVEQSLFRRTKMRAAQEDRSINKLESQAALQSAQLRVRAATYSADLKDLGARRTSARKTTDARFAPSPVEVAHRHLPDALKNPR